VLGIPGIAGYGECDVGTAEALDGRLQFVGLASGDDHAVTPVDQLPSDGQADSTAAAGDQSGTGGHGRDCIQRLFRGYAHNRELSGRTRDGYAHNRRKCGTFVTVVRTAKGGR